MDACLQLLLPAVVQIEGLECKQPSFTWQGTSYVQGPNTFHWGPYVELIQTSIPTHHLKYLPETWRSDPWIALALKREGFDLLEQEVNGCEVDWLGMHLEELLRRLVSQCPRWVFIVELHCDQIDSVYTSTIEPCIDRLRHNLRGDVTPEGFVVVSGE